MPIFRNQCNHILYQKLDSLRETHCTKYTNKLIMVYSDCQRASLVILFIILEVSDLVFDWDFYIELSNSDRYKEAPERWAVLAFALWGTVNFFLALTCLVRSVRTGKRRKWEDAVDLSTTWLEDVPQMILAAKVAVEVGEPITNWVQYTKAGLAIGEALLRCVIILVTCCPCCTECHDDDTADYCDDDCTLSCASNWMNFFGYLAILICAIVVLGVFAAG